MKKLTLLCILVLTSSVCQVNGQPTTASEPPLSNREFWQEVCVKYQMDNYYQSKNHRRQLRKLNEASVHFLADLAPITYEDAYIQDYVQGLFTQVSPGSIDPNKPEIPDIHIIQSPDPEAYMLPNGTMLVSTGLLCTLDSEEELKAIMANEMAHYVLNDQVCNILQAKRAAAWGTALFCVAYLGTAVLSASIDNNYDDDNDHTEAIAAGITAIAGIGAVASIATAESLVNPQLLGDLGMKYRLNQEIIADQVANEFLVRNDIQPDALSSAVKKINQFYEAEQRTKHLTRYNSCKTLKRRIKKMEKGEMLPQNHFYRKATSDVLTFNAAMYQNDGQYAKAEQLVQKNIDEDLASDYDYLILVKSRMAQINTPDSNETCMELLQKARERSEMQNLDINKQEILLLMRMNKQAKAAEALKEYLELLRQYGQQDRTSREERKWMETEVGWAKKMLSKISML